MNLIYSKYLNLLFKNIAVIVFLFLINNTFCNNLSQYGSLFPKEEYEHYLNLIRTIDAEAYKKLVGFEIKNDQDGLLNGNYLEIISGNEESNGYPIIVMPSIMDWTINAQKDFLKNNILSTYNQMPIISKITESERHNTLEIINQIDPKLYTLITNVDPEGIKHIERDYSSGPIASTASEDDGLPIILIGEKVKLLSTEEKKAVIAHELGHFALEHVKERKGPIIALKITVDPKKNTKIVTGQLPFEETFDLAYSRINEYEADRFSVINLGIDVDTAIATQKKLISDEFNKSLSELQRETFKRTHPWGKDRIAHFNELRREVELNKARNKQQKPIQWEEIAKDYVKWFSEHPL